MNIFVKLAMTIAGNIMIRSNCFTVYQNVGFRFRGFRTGKEYILCLYDTDKFYLDEQEGEIEDVRLLPENTDL